MSERQKIIYGRKTLKTLFKRGQLPSEEDFEILVDSTFNRYDDNLDVTPENGLQVHAVNEGQLISFFDHTDEGAVWKLKFSKNYDGIIFEKQGQHKAHSTKQALEGDATEDAAVFYIANKGNVGIGTAAPEHKLDVRGLIASKGRIGTYVVGTKPANGKWQNVFTADTLPDFSAFEIMAAARGETQREVKYAFSHATAIGVRGNGKSKVTTTKAYHGRRWNKIDFRWESRDSRLDQKAPKNWFKRFLMLFEPKNPKRYNLQIRTHSNFGENALIRYRVTKLWDDDIDSTRSMAFQNSDSR